MSGSLASLVPLDDGSHWRQVRDARADALERSEEPGACRMPAQGPARSPCKTPGCGALLYGPPRHCPTCRATLDAFRPSTSAQSAGPAFISPVDVGGLGHSHRSNP